MEGTRLAGRKPFMPRKPGQQKRMAVQSAFWAAHSWQWQSMTRYGLIANAGPRGERLYRLTGGLAGVAFKCAPFGATITQVSECYFSAKIS